MEGVFRWPGKARGLASIVMHLQVLVAVADQSFWWG